MTQKEDLETSLNGIANSNQNVSNIIETFYDSLGDSISDSFIEKFTSEKTAEFILAYDVYFVISFIEQLDTDNVIHFLNSLTSLNFSYQDIIYFVKLPGFHYYGMDHEFKSSLFIKLNINNVILLLGESGIMNCVEFVKNLNITNNDFSQTVKDFINTYNTTNETEKINYIKNILALTDDNDLSKFTPNLLGTALLQKTLVATSSKSIDDLINDFDDVATNASNIIKETSGVIIAEFINNVSSEKFNNLLTELNNDILIKYLKTTLIFDGQQSNFDFINNMNSMEITNIFITQLTSIDDGAVNKLFNGFVYSIINMYSDIDSYGYRIYDPSSVNLTDEEVIMILANFVTNCGIYDTGIGGIKKSRAADFIIPPNILHVSDSRAASATTIANLSIVGLDKLENLIKKENIGGAKTHAFILPSQSHTILIPSATVVINTPYSFLEKFVIDCGFYNIQVDNNDILKSGAGDFVNKHGSISTIKLINEMGDMVEFKNLVNAIASETDISERVIKILEKIDPNNDASSTLNIFKNSFTTQQTALDFMNECKSVASAYIIRDFSNFFSFMESLGVTKTVEFLKSMTIEKSIKFLNDINREADAISFIKDIDLSVAPFIIKNGVNNKGEYRVALLINDIGIANVITMVKRNRDNASSFISTIADNENISQNLITFVTDTAPSGINFIEMFGFDNFNAFLHKINSNSIGSFAYMFTQINDTNFLDDLIKSNLEDVINLINNLDYNVLKNFINNYDSSSEPREKLRIFLNSTGRFSESEVSTILNTFFEITTAIANTIINGTSVIGIGLYLYTITEFSAINNWIFTENTITWQANAINPDAIVNYINSVGGKFMAMLYNKNPIDFIEKVTPETFDTFVNRIDIISLYDFIKRVPTQDAIITFMKSMTEIENDAMDKIDRFFSQATSYDLADIVEHIKIETENGQLFYMADNLLKNAPNDIYTLLLDTLPYEGYHISVFLCSSFYKLTNGIPSIDFDTVISFLKHYKYTRDNQLYQAISLTGDNKLKFMGENKNKMFKLNEFTVSATLSDNVSFDSVNIHNINFENIDFSGINLNNSNFINCTMHEIFSSNVVSGIDSKLPIGWYTDMNVIYGPTASFKICNFVDKTFYNLTGLKVEDSEFDGDHNKLPNGWVKKLYGNKTIILGPGADMRGMNIPNSYKYLLEDLDLTGANLHQVGISSDVSLKGLRAVSIKGSPILYTGKLLDGIIIGKGVNLSNTVIQPSSYQQKNVLNGLDLSGSNFSGSTFKNLYFGNITVTNIDLTGSSFENVSFGQLTGNFTHLPDDIWRLLNISNSTAGKKILLGHGVKISDSYELRNVDISDAILSDIIFDNGAVLDFSNSKMVRTNFTRANIPNVIFNNSIAHGVICKNGDFEDSQCRDSNFSLGNFTNSNLTSADFTNSNLTDVIFKNSLLFGVNFSGANLSNTDFDGAYIKFAFGKDISGTPKNLPSGWGIADGLLISKNISHPFFKINGIYLQLHKEGLIATILKLNKQRLYNVKTSEGLLFDIFVGESKLITKITNEQALDLFKQSENVDLNLCEDVPVYHFSELKNNGYYNTSGDFPTVINIFGLNDNSDFEVTLVQDSKYDGIYELAKMGSATLTWTGPTLYLDQVNSTVEKLIFKTSSSDVQNITQAQVDLFNYYGHPHFQIHVDDLCIQTKVLGVKLINSHIFTDIVKCEDKIYPTITKLKFEDWTQMSYGNTSVTIKMATDNMVTKNGQSWNNKYTGEADTLLNEYNTSYSTQQDDSIYRINFDSTINLPGNVRTQNVNLHITRLSKYGILYDVDKEKWLTKNDVIPLCKFQTNAPQNYTAKMIQQTKNLLVWESTTTLPALVFGDDNPDQANYGDKMVQDTIDGINLWVNTSDSTDLVAQETNPDSTTYEAKTVQQTKNLLGWTDKTTIIYSETRPNKNSEYDYTPLMTQFHDGVLKWAGKNAAVTPSTVTAATNPDNTTYDPKMVQDTRNNVNIWVKKTNPKYFVVKNTNPDSSNYKAKMVQDKENHIKGWISNPQNIDSAEKEYVINDWYKDGTMKTLQFYINSSSAFDAAKNEDFISFYYYFSNNLDFKDVSCSKASIETRPQLNATIPYGALYVTDTEAVYYSGYDDINIDIVNYLNNTTMESLDFNINNVLNNVVIDNNIFRGLTVNAAVKSKTVNRYDFTLFCDLFITNPTNDTRVYLNSGINTLFFAKTSTLENIIAIDYPSNFSTSMSNLNLTLKDESSIIYHSTRSNWFFKNIPKLVGKSINSSQFDFGGNNNLSAVTGWINGGSNSTSITPSVYDVTPPVAYDSTSNTVDINSGLNTPGTYKLRYEFSGNSTTTIYKNLFVVIKPIEIDINLNRHVWNKIQASITQPTGFSPLLVNSTQDGKLVWYREAISETQPSGYQAKNIQEAQDGLPVWYKYDESSQVNTRMMCITKPDGYQTKMVQETVGGKLVWFSERISETQPTGYEAKMIQKTQDNVNLWVNKTDSNDVVAQEVNPDTVTYEAKNVQDTLDNVNLWVSKTDSNDVVAQEANPDTATYEAKMVQDTMDNVAMWVKEQISETQPAGYDAKNMFSNL